MDYTLIKCSPAAEAKIESFVDSVGTSEQGNHRTIYPFNKMEIGKAFALKLESNINAIRANISRLNRQTLKEFVLIRHDEFKCYEVARIK